MRILHVISSLNPAHGGPAMALAGLARAQRSQQHDVSVLTPWRDSEDHRAAQSVAADRILVEAVGPCKGPTSWHPALSAKARAMTRSADIVHIHALWEEVQHAAARAARHESVPYIFRPCGMLDPWSLRQSWLRKRLYLAVRLRRDLNSADALHYTTDLERDLAAPLKLSPQAIVQPNGLDLSEFQSLPPRGTFRARHGLPVDRPLVLFLGRIHPKKGLELLLPAFARAAGDAHLVIAGPDDNGHRAIIERLAADLKLSDRVLFTGMLRGTDRVAAFADADLFVLPSHQENFGIAVAEAWASGCPTIVSDQVNLHSEVTRHRLGAVVPTSIDRLAAAMAQWLANPSQRFQAGQRARAFAFAQYDWNEIARRWTTHYGKLIAEAQTR